MHQVHQKARAGPKSQNESAETTFYQSLENLKLGKFRLGKKKPFYQFRCSRFGART